MLEMTLLALRVRFTMAANRLIYFLRNLPILKRILSPTLYGEYNLKTVLTVFGAIFIASKKIFQHSMVMGIAFFTGLVQHLIVQSGGVAGLAGLLSADNPFAGASMAMAAEFALLTWFIVTVPGCFTRPVTASTDLNYKNDDIMINYLGANPALYAKARIFIDQLAHILLYTPYFLIVFFVAGIPIWGVLTTLMLMSAFRLLGEVINLAMFKRFGRHFGRGAHANIAGWLILAVAVAIPLFIQVENISIIFANPIVALVSAAIGFLSWRYIRSYTHYRKLLIGKIRWLADLMAKSQQGGAMAAEIAEARKWNKSVDTEDLDSGKHSNKTGFAYLNSIFFDRHSKYFKKKILTRCYFTLLLPVIVVGYMLYESITGSEPLRNVLGLDADNMSYLFSYAPIFFFIIYVASLGRVVTASVFSNCDIQMLHYSYYRTRENIFSSFKSRITMILKYNLIITTLMSVCAIFAVSLLFGYFDFMLSGVFFIVLTTIGVLFAFNDLFLYYVIQPYDSVGKGKSIVYSIINFVIYVIAWINLTTIFDFFTYSAVIVGATAAYIGIGLILLPALAPRRFKLR